MHAESHHRARMVARVFRAHGELCASHPWEVIVATLTLTACMLTVDQRNGDQPHCLTPHSCLEEYNAADMIMMTVIRCVAVLYCYYQFCNLHKLGSKYILGIAGLFTVFSSFVFTSSVINFLQSDISDLKDALFFFLLLIDLSKATILAQLALSGRSQDEVRRNIARGMENLGPTITLDTLVETLVIGVGTLSGVRRLEVLCCFACMSVIVNYAVFMTFYPACLSLILELSRGGEPLRDRSVLMRAFQEEDQKPNPVVQRVKVIMSAGLMLVHAHSRLTLTNEEDEGPMTPLIMGEHNIVSNRTEDVAIQDFIMKWLTISADHIVVLILLLALAVKFIFFESKGDLAEQILMSEKAISTDSSSMSRMVSDGWVEICAREMSTEHKSVQTEHVESTEAGVDDTDITNQQEDPVDLEPRSYEQCLEIYQSQKTASVLSDSEVMLLVEKNAIPSYQIEKAVGDLERAVGIRRQIVAKLGEFSHALSDLPYLNYDYSKVQGACCENVMGYVPVPLGVAGPLNLDGRLVYVPMATTEGCLVASTHRGCRALQKCGVTSRVVADGMTRGPVVRFPSITRASEAMAWMQTAENFEQLKQSFDSTSRFAQLFSVVDGSTGSFLECSEPDSEIRPISDFGTLLLSSVMFRHGERNIIKSYPTDPYSSGSYWPEGFGQLVRMGKKREYDIGTWLRERYRNILPIKYLPDYVYTRSTDVDRTLMSATAALASLFPPSEKDVFQKGLNWQPVPVHTVPEYLDEVLSSKKSCPKYNSTLEEFLNSPEMKAFNKKHEDFYKFLTNKTGMRIDDVREVAYLYDTLYIENWRNLSLPDWTNDIFPEKMFQFSVYSFRIPTIVHELKRLRSGPLIKEIISHMVQKVNHSLIPDRTLYIYSAHDDTISSLLNSLGVFNCIPPPYGATVLIELWEMKTSKHAVTVSYRNQTNSEPYVFIIPGCSAACPLEKFVELVSNVIPDNWEQECQIELVESNLELKAFKIFSLILSAGIILLIVINVFTLCCRRKEETSYKYQQISTETS